MTQQEFERLAETMRKLAKNIPHEWGEIQNNDADDKIDIFGIHTYDELESKIANSPDDYKKYVRRRWYLTNCSKCDEYLFYKNENVIENPNPCAKSWDIKINDTFYFDVKGTVVPKEMRNNIGKLIENPQEMIDFFYENQSKERRHGIQNRLFIVHHSFVDAKRELYLRCAWLSKEKIYKLFCERVNDARFFKSHGVAAGVIFIFERELLRVDYFIPGITKQFCTTKE